MKDVPIETTTLDGTYRILQLFFRDSVTSTTEYKIMMQSKKVNQSHYRPEIPRGFQEV